MEAAISPEQPERREVPEQLKPHCWKPGQSGNPEGRPSDRKLRQALREALEAEDAALAKRVIRNIGELASGNSKLAVAAASLMFEQYEPPIEKKIEHSGSIERTVRIEGVDTP